MCIGKEYEIIIDRPLGSFHPDYPSLFYSVNYGYVEGIYGGDGEEQDVYLLGVNIPVEKYKAKIMPVIKRLSEVLLAKLL